MMNKSICLILKSVVLLYACECDSNVNMMEKLRCPRMNGSEFNKVTVT